MQINSLPAGGAVVAGEREVSTVTLYTKQNPAHKHCFIRHYDINDIQHFLKTVCFHQKYSDIKTPALGLIMKRVELNQAFTTRQPGFP